MNKEEWFKLAEINRDRLEYLIERYHPVCVSKTDYQFKRLEDKLPITASAAESACEAIRDEIRKEPKSNPIAEFHQALKDNNMNKIYSILNLTWFGVPESTSCWQIKGFKEAVELMEEIPDTDVEQN